MAKARYYATPVSQHRGKTPEGYLIAFNIPIGRTGWQDYRAAELGLDGDHRVSVYRDAADVFSAETLGSFEGKTVVSPHPPVFLTSENDLGYSRGHAQNIRRGDPLPDGEFSLVADLIIKDAQLISQIENGSIAEVSCGYQCKYVPMEGGDGLKFQQTEIRGNHVAVVPSGRAGSSVKILDAANGETEAELDLKSILIGLGWRAPAKDSASEPVEINAELNAEALQRAERRNEDAMEKDKDKAKDTKAKDGGEEEMKKEEKGAATPKDAASDAAAARDAKLTDALTMIVDRLEKLEARDRKAKDDDEEEEKKEKMEDADEEEKEEKESEDSDLIPVPTLAENERPENPIPGADKALDTLRALKPVIARTGDRKAIIAYNQAVRDLQGAGNNPDHSTDAYRDAAHASAQRHGTFDSNPEERVRASGDEFVQTARQFHRRNAGEVVQEIARKETK